MCPFFNPTLKRYQIAAFLVYWHDTYGYKICSKKLLQLAFEDSVETSHEITTPFRRGLRWTLKHRHLKKYIINKYPKETYYVIRPHGLKYGKFIIANKEKYCVSIPETIRRCIRARENLWVLDLAFKDYEEVCKNEKLKSKFSLGDIRG